MNKTEKIKLIYSIVIGVFTVAMGVALICVAADIYYSGRGTGVIFTREIVVERLQALAIPFVILIGMIACGVIFPLYEVKAKRPSEDGVKLLLAKKPTGGSGEAYERAVKNYSVNKEEKFNLWLGTLVIILICMIASLYYLLNTANFLSDDITSEIFGMVKNVLPWVALAFATLIAATISNGVIASSQLKNLKQVIKTGNGIPQGNAEPKTYGKIKSILESDKTLWIVRGLVFAVAVTFVVLGVCNGGAHDVLVKAINICTECIGLG